MYKTHLVKGPLDNLNNWLNALDPTTTVVSIMTGSLDHFIVVIKEAGD